MTDDNKNKGRGWHGDHEGHAEAGRLGGETTAAEQGEEFYSEIGRDGNRSRNQNQDQSNLADDSNLTVDMDQEDESR